MAFTFSETQGQQWPQILQLLLAVVFTSIIGAERQVRQKNAGLRTHALIGLGAALYTLTSKYGFTDVLVPRTVVLDPSRIAAQIVSGLGFIGGGIIFKQENAVRGLTTAASVWLSAAIGTACAAGLPIIAALGCGLYFVAIMVYPRLFALMTRLLSKTGDVGVFSDVELVIRYRQGDRALEAILRAIKDCAFRIHSLELFDSIDSLRDQLRTQEEHETSLLQNKAKSDSDVILDHHFLHSMMRHTIRELRLKVSGEGSTDDLICRLSGDTQVTSVSVVDDDKTQEV